MDRRDGVWPRTYRLRRGQRVFLGALGVVAFVGGLVGAGAILSARADAPPALALIPLGFAALGAYLLAALRVGRIVLYEDAIEFVELGRGHRRLRRDEIAGRRLRAMQYGQMQLVLELRGGRKPVKVHWAHESDAVLDAWLFAIPDLDAEDRARAESELLRSPALGRDEAERRRTLQRARKIARALNGVAIAAAAWGWFYPRPYRVAIATLAVLPLVGLALLLGGRGRYAFDSVKTDARASVIVSVVGPGLVLAMRSISDLRVIDWERLLFAAAVLGAGLVVAVAAGDRKARKPWVLLLLAPLVFAYPWGGLSLANALLDRGVPQMFRVPVRGKHVTTGKHTSWDVELDPWGPVTERKRVDVGRGLYRSVEIGDRVCVALRPGALGARWFVVLTCR